MADQNQTNVNETSPWPHRWAVALVCATFPLIWVGGLVTSYDAGMAVPDWPNTYGYNLFLYPLETWINGPWSLFIEHGHRLLGSLVGMLTIGFLLSTWWCQRATMLRVLGFVALAGVLFQGALGGLRVIENKVQLAQIHGCFGPAFFAFTVALAAITSPFWRSAARGDRVATERTGLAKVERLAVLTTLLAYGQLVLGSFLRHLPTGAQPGDFRIVLFFHLGTALALVAHSLMLARQVHRTQRGEAALWRPALALAALVCVEVCLGSATWVSKYGWPEWLAGFDFAAAHVVSGVSRPQAWITTAHVATGSLILGTSLLVALRSIRLAWHPPRLPARGALMMEAAR